MARIAIGVCGEGRGHASRACSLLERLPGRHEFLVVSTAEAMRIMAGRLADDGIAARVLDVPGIRFAYAGGRLDLARTIASGLWYRWRLLPAILDRVTREVEAFGADLVVTDFEPVRPRAARRLGIPVVSLDHQHFLQAYDLAARPRGLRWQAACMRPAVRMYVQDRCETIVSACFRPPRRGGRGTKDHPLSRVRPQSCRSRRR